jgi:cell division protein FtsW
MTGNVTSIAAVRALARRKAERSRVNSRLATTVLLVAIVLIVIGLGETLSASSAKALADRQDRFYFFKRQLVGLGVGTVVMLILSRLPYRAWRRLATPVFISTLGLLTLVLAVGERVNGARRWLAIGPLSLQPSELAKLGVVVMLAVLIERKQKVLSDLSEFAGPVVFCIGSLGILIMAEPDLGTTLVVAVAGLAVLLVSTAPFRHVMTVTTAAVILAVALAFAAGYRQDRIEGYLDPWADAGGKGYQLIQGYYALATGGVFGVGLGASRSRWSYLPNAHTDFIFAILGEETGLVGGLVVIGLFVLLAVAGWAVASRAPDRFGRMLAAGITAWLSFQALVNVGGVLGVVPITGITLPFVSYGSTALISSMAALGILVNIAQHGRTGAEP